MIASDIIQKVRYTISDPNSERWTDNRLLSLLNDALLDLALTTRLYNAVKFLQLFKNSAIYSLADIAIKIERVEYLDKPLEKFSYRLMDETFGANWQTEESDTPTHIAYDLRKSAEFKVYPIPTLGAVNTTISNSNFGIITDINYEDVQVVIGEGSGDIDAPNLVNYLKVYYIAEPVKLTALTDTLDPVIDRTMLSTLAHYVAGMALRDNMDTQNRAMANEEIALYENKKQMFTNEKMVNNVKKVRTTGYRSII